MQTLDSFYRSREWETLIKKIRIERLNSEGFNVCEFCGRPIVKAYDCIGHHKTALTEENVADVTISLNPDNIALVHHGCHNRIHEKLAYSRKEVFLVYGPPLAGKTTYVDSVKVPGDLIIDMDNIWQSISGMPRYQKPARLKSVAFGVRDYLMDALKVRNGRWQNAYIVGGFPMTGERERIVREYGAREIGIIPEREECIRRLREASDGRSVEEWETYIDDWFRKYAPPPGASDDGASGKC